jgi:hypothetical protein
VWHAKVTGNEEKSKWKFGLILRMSTFRKLTSAKLKDLGLCANTNGQLLFAARLSIFFASKAGKKGFPAKQRSHSSGYHFSTFIMQ